MNSSDSQSSIILNFVYHRFDSLNYDTETRHMLKEYVNQEINLLLWFALIGITVLLLKKCAFLLKIWVYGRRIPGPPPFYGHSKLISRDTPQHDLTELFAKSHEQYGPMVKLWLSPTELLVSIKDPSLINDMLLKASDKMPLVGRVYRLAFGQSRFFVSSFEKVKSGRQTLAVELNGKLLANASKMTDRVVDSVMERFSSIMDQGILDSTMFSQHLAFSIMGATFFSDTFFTWSKANAYEELLLKIAKDAFFWASYSVPPFWKRGYWKYRHLCSKLKGLTQDIVQHCQPNKLLSQSNCYSSYKTETKSASGISFTSVVEKLEKLNSKESCCPLNLLEEPCGNIMGMMFHGCLTTAGLISNILARLVTHPEIQEQIYSEVTIVRRVTDNKSEIDVSEMHLLLATIYESARLLPAGPLLQRCSLQQDLQLKNGALIPAGAVLVAPVQLVQMDEVNWGSDAGSFNPYRFLSKAEKRFDLDGSPGTADAAEVPAIPAEGSYILKNPYKNASFLSFGSGLRACVGQKFAVLGVASVFASLLENYEIKFATEPEVEPRAQMVNCVLQLVPSPKLVFVRRNT